MCLGCVLKVLLWGWPGGWYPAWNTSAPPRNFHFSFVEWCIVFCCKIEVEWMNAQTIIIECSIWSKTYLCLFFLFVCFVFVCFIFDFCLFFVCLFLFLVCCWFSLMHRIWLEMNLEVLVLNVKFCNIAQNKTEIFPLRVIWSDNDKNCWKFPHVHKRC